MTKTTRRLLVAAALVLTLGFAACGGEVSSASDEPTESQLEAAKDFAGTDAQHLTIADQGHTLVIDGDGDYKSPGASLATTVAVLTYLEAPAAVVSRMSNTRALDGMQEGSWGDFTASWTYHPDNGLDLIIEES